MSFWLSTFWPDCFGDAFYEKVIDFCFFTCVCGCLVSLSDQNECYIWAASRQNQQNGMCTQQRLGSARASTESDQSSVSAGRKLGFLPTLWVHSKDWSDLAYAQADLSLCWAHIHFVGFVMRRLIYFQSVVYISMHNCVCIITATSPSPS